MIDQLNPENHMVLPLADRIMPDYVPTRICQLCGDNYIYRPFETFDYACPACVRRTEQKAVELLKKNLSPDELGVLEDAWTLYADV